MMCLQFGNCGVQVFEVTTDTGLTDINSATTELATVTALSRCTFCPNGLTAEPGLVLPTDDGATCGAVLEFSMTLAAGDPSCSVIQRAETLC